MYDLVIPRRDRDGTLTLIFILLQISRFGVLHCGNILLVCSDNEICMVLNASEQNFS